MELLDVIQKIAAGYVQGAALTELAIGTVTNVGPLEITLEESRLPLPQSVLRLTSAVVEKKIPILSHSHSAPGGMTGMALDDIACMEHGKLLPNQGDYILINRGLSSGDKVLMLRVSGGQSYIVLSRVF